MPNFPHALLREIFEQPEAIKRTLDLYLDSSGLKAEAFAPLAQWLNPRGEVLIAASGSSRHAGLAAGILFDDLCGLADDVEYSSEYACHPTANPRHPSVVVISQSGETSDTLAALRFAREGSQPISRCSIWEHCTSTNQAPAQRYQVVYCGWTASVFKCRRRVENVKALRELRRSERSSLARLCT